jgi:tetratricopeptide (TPR) repeat protein
MQKKSEEQELTTLCGMVRALLPAGEYCKCKELISEAMKEFPNSAQPHNLFGLVLEREGNHPSAMKHFRAAWALDPTFWPARQNLEHYGTFDSGGCCAFDQSDCGQDVNNNVKVIYDKQGVGHVERESEDGSF